MRRLLFALVISWICTSDPIAMAQPACDALLQTSLASLRTACVDQNTIGACYGHGPLDVSLVQDTAEGFLTPGAIIDLDIIDTLALSPFDLDNRGWGLVQLSIPLNQTDNVITLLALGDVTLTNTGDSAETVPSALAPIRANQGANIRALPQADATLLTTAFTGDPIRVTGRTPDRAWVRVRLADGRIGWVVASAFNSSDLADLVTVDAAEPPGFGPLQAFTLATEPGRDSTCREAPPDGVLLQTPSVPETAVIQVNGYTLRIAPQSTVFMTTPADDLLRVNVLEGSAQAQPESADDPLMIEAGSGVVFAAVPPVADVYNYAAMGRLPFRSLPRPTYAAIDFDRLLTTPRTGSTLANIGPGDPCTIAAGDTGANLREAPNPSGRVRHVMQPGERALPDARQQGTDGVLWWRLTADVWVRSDAVQAAGECGTLPVIGS